MSEPDGNANMGTPPRGEPPSGFRTPPPGTSQEARQPSGPPPRPEPQVPPAKYMRLGGAYYKATLAQDNITPLSWTMVTPNKVPKDQLPVYEEVEDDVQSQVSHVSPSRRKRSLPRDDNLDDEDNSRLPPKVGRSDAQHFRSWMTREREYPGNWNS